MGRLDGKVALITGGACGIGASFAKAFAQEGAKVIITDLLDEYGEKTAREIGDSAIFLKHDVTCKEEWEEVVTKGEEKFGNITVLVNNTGIVRNEPALEVTPESYEKVYKMSQLGVLLGMQAVIPSMQIARQGSIINIASVSGTPGQAEGIAYNATKFALRGMTKTIAEEFGKDGIRANSIYPGMIKTEMTAKEELQQMLNHIARAIPLDCAAEPEEITNLCLFLASDESRYSSGAEFVVRGQTPIAFTR